MSLVMPNGQPQPAQQGQYQNPAYAQMEQAYQKYLGRAPESYEAAMSHVGRGTPQEVQRGIQTVQYSDEAREYMDRQRQQPAQQQQQAPPPQEGGPAPQVSGVPPVYSGPSAMQYASGAARNAASIQSSFVPQQIRDFTGRQVNAPTYAQTVFSQFNDPRNMGVQGGKDTLLMNLLQNPHSMSQQVQDQMFESQKDDALAFAKQAGLANIQNLVGRGLNLGGGTAQAMESDLQGNLISQLLAGRRDIAAQAALQNRADELNAIQAAEAGLSGDTSRAGSIFQNLLAGQQAQAGDNRFAAEYGLNRETAMAGNERDNYASYLAGRGLQGQENARGEQFRQSAFGLSEAARNNARSGALQEWMAQNNSDLGWANYGLSADQQFLDFLGGQY